jgi:hypothetical protein
MASPFIRPSALKGPTGSHGMPRVATAARNVDGLVCAGSSPLSM